MKVILNIKPLILSIFSFSIAAMTVTETIDNFISFASEDHAMAFFFLSSFMGLLGAAGSFELLKQNK